jgi:transcriptional regulator with XRE-family HTH domain
MSRESPTIEEILDEVSAAKMRIDQLEGMMANTLEWRNQSIRKLRHYLSAAEIARRVGLTRQTIYSVLQGESGASEELDPEELPNLIARLADSAHQFQNVADGKTPLATPNPIGMQMLADNLKWAVEWLEAMLSEEQRVDKWTYELRDEWWAYERRRNEDGIKSRQYPHQQDIIIHQLANRLGTHHAATVLGLPIEQILDALARPGLDGHRAVDVDMDRLVAGGVHPESND